MFANKRTLQHRQLRFVWAARGPGGGGDLPAAGPGRLPSCKGGALDAVHRGAELGGAFAFLSSLILLQCFICNHSLGLRLLKLLGFRDYPFWMLLSSATSLNTCWVYIPSIILEILVVIKGKKNTKNWSLNIGEAYAPQTEYERTEAIPAARLLVVGMWGTHSLECAFSLLSGSQGVRHNWSDLAHTHACRVLRQLPTVDWKDRTL